MYWLKSVSGFFITNLLISVCFGAVWFAVDLQSSKCLDNVNSFQDALLLSLEIQTTIGFGGRSVTGHCTINIIILWLHSFITLLLNGICITKIGLEYFSKISHTQENETFVMSNNTKSLECEEL